MPRRPSDDRRLLDLSPGEFNRRIKQKGIGGSDIGAILGLGRYQTRQSVWEQKMGTAPRQTENVDKRRGKILEAVCAEEYSLATGRVLGASRVIKRDGDQYWMRGTPDRFILSAPPQPVHPYAVGPGLLEIKCLRLDGFYRTRDEGINPEYYCQLQWYMHIGWQSESSHWTPYQWGAFAVFNAEDWVLHEFDVVYDHDFAVWLEHEAATFWHENVLARVAPTTTPTIPAVHLDAMRAANGAQTVDVESLSGSANRAPWRIAIEALTRARAELTLAERADSLATDRVKELLDAQGYEAIRGFGASISYREQTRRTLNRHALADAHPEIDLEPFMETSASRPFRFSLRTPGDTRRSRGTNSNPDQPAGLDATFAPTISDALASGRPIIMPGSRVDVRTGTPENPGEHLGTVTGIDWASPLDRDRSARQWTTAGNPPPPLTTRELERATETIMRHVHEPEPLVVSRGEAAQRLYELGQPPIAGDVIPDPPAPRPATEPLSGDGDEAIEAVEAPRRPRDGAATTTPSFDEAEFDRAMAAAPRRVRPRRPRAP